jgi:hypothetical protein
MRTTDIRLRHAAHAAAAAIVLVASAPARGQQPAGPHAGFAYPAGGRQGTTVEVTVGGRSLEGVTGVVFTARGLEAEIAGYDKPLSQREITELRDKAQELQKSTMTPDIRRQLIEMRNRIGDSVRRLSNPVLAETVTLRVAVGADAEPGPWQLRLVTPLGVSNPVAFTVSQLPEFVETEPDAPTADAGSAGRAGARGAGRGAQAGPEQAPPPPDPPQRVTLPVVVNGRIIPSDPRQGPGGGRRQPNQYAPGDTDRFVFEARKGQALVVAVSARDVMPYLADAVPGWFQATVALFDAAGREVAYADDHRFQPDPVLHYRIPADGDYTVEIKDAIFRGREDFVYRISIGELPYVTGIFPLGGPARTRTTVEVKGWNLPTGTVTMDATGAGPGTATLTVRRGAVVSNRVPFAIDSLRDASEGEPNDAPKQAAKLTLPVIVNGRIQAAGDVDVFAIAGRAGEQVVAEVTARRLGSPLDSVLELTDASGARLAVSDDVADRAAGLVTHQADSRIVITLPANGAYYLRVGDLQRKGGAEYGYRLRVGAPQPDFEVRVTPAEINAGAGSSVVVTAHAIRRDGFAGDITLSLKDAPPGFTLSGGVVPAGRDQVRMTVNVPPMRPAGPFSIGLEAQAAVQGRNVSHRAQAAEEMMQAFAYRHLVPADHLRVSVLARGGTRFPARFVSGESVSLRPGGSARVQVVLPVARALENVQLELTEPPEGVSIGDVRIDGTGASFVVTADAAVVKPGLRGNLIVAVSGERVPSQRGNQAGTAGSAPAPAARRRVPVGVLPAIPFEVSSPK